MYMKIAEQPVLVPSLNLEMCPQIAVGPILYILCGHFAHLKLKGRVEGATSVALSLPRYLEG